jgi:plastocyanin domain-containing protein
MMKLVSFMLAMAVAVHALADAPKVSAPRIEIAVTKAGFEPGNIKVAAGKPVSLVFTRKTDSTCAKKVIVKLDDKTSIERELPLDKPVEVAVTFPKAGTLSYACSMDMIKGVIVVQ